MASATVLTTGSSSASDSPAWSASSRISASAAPMAWAARDIIQRPAARISSSASSGVFFRSTAASTTAVTPAAASLAMSPITAETGP